ncbi:hypothetical protein ABIA30_002769 [Mycobacterium sp. MAA66]|uniref:hypothetical protein n=1 Tax=Mycobacterium sp. MAA66 TaxID=3156297 RepID=UPI0035188D1C
MHNKALSAELEALRGSQRGCHVSAVALEVHVRAVYRSVRTRSPAFVPDFSLDAIASGSVTTMAALELCLAGLWHRCGDGYLVDDPDLIAHLSVGPVRRLARKAWRYLNSESVLPF